MDFDNVLEEIKSDDTHQAWSTSWDIIRADKAQLPQVLPSKIKKPVSYNVLHVLSVDML